MKLIGIGGTNGSGKDSLGKILAEDYGYLDISVSDFLRDEAKKRKLPIERQVLRTISAEWRRNYGHGVLVDKAIEQFKKSGSKYKGLVAVPMRNPGEAQHLKDLGGILVWLDADPKLRYQRIYSRQRSAEDQKTFEQFLAEENDEMDHQNGDEATLNMAAVKDKSDIFITNDTNDIEEFSKQVKEALKDFL
jgi:dephospho-CoA kinase